LRLGLVGGADWGPRRSEKLRWGEDEQRSERAFAAKAEARDTELVRTMSLPLLPHPLAAWTACIDPLKRILKSRSPSGLRLFWGSGLKRKIKKFKNRA